MPCRGGRQHPRATMMGRGFSGTTTAALPRSSRWRLLSRHPCSVARRWRPPPTSWPALQGGGALERALGRTLTVFTVLAMVTIAVGTMEGLGTAMGTIAKGTIEGSGTAMAVRRVCEAVTEIVSIGNRRVGFWLIHSEKRWVRPIKSAGRP